MGPREKPTSHAEIKEVDEDKERYSAEELSSILRVKIGEGSSLSYLKRDLEDGKAIAIAVTKNFDIWLSSNHTGIYKDSGIDDTDVVLECRCNKTANGIGFVAYSNFKPIFRRDLDMDSVFGKFINMLGEDNARSIVLSKMQEILD
ncbi:MAG: hypothetical protein A3A80_01880 [Candidatus Terrybacteria bacterium RIFCSPLOWO2_01_FULL_44_24]|uniref:Uncharacterized protein n=1 Tax=Candidatus Terrybacteria bacterium RIFCSPHIGHO2_01_FULL_43_35 TaxID=1802361 RepID=A0A1G2PE37_9BACT|nr:MAG: hypothetical protein A2828_01670 [Candidatus Terrybacteria bacterium RIFCSPHIGHO2_01_FULL_43_35]OHA50832.1 MAG: hypothetical protein A3A80_01880 [Candidatus Terrybacteria bacterium RIFCSPLOWO2_01_FULL_44_24]